MCAWECSISLGIAVTKREFNYYDNLLSPVCLETFSDYFFTLKKNKLEQKRATKILNDLSDGAM